MANHVSVKGPQSVEMASSKHKLAMATRTRQAQLEAAVWALEEDRAALRFMLRDMEASRRRIEHAKREWTETVDSIPDPIFLHDADLRVLRANRAYADRAGIPIEQIIGQPYWRMFPRREAPICNCQQLRRDESVAIHEDELQEPDGHIYRCRAFAVRDADGAYQYSVHILEDVTVQRQLDAEQHFYSEALNQTKEAVLLIDPDHRIVHANPAFGELFGYTRESIIGQPITVLAADGADPETQPAVIGERIARGQSWRGEVVRRTVDGTLVPVLLAAAPVFVDGIQLGTVATYVDLRDIRAAEKALQRKERELQTLMSNLPGMAYRCRNDKDRTMEFASAGVQALTGYLPTDLENNSVTAFGGLIVTEDRDRVRIAVQNAVDQGVPYVIEYRIRDAVGTLRWVWERGAPVVEDGRDKSMLEGFITDITERKQAEAALRESEERYRTLFTTVLDGFALHEIVLDEHRKPVDYRFLEVNPAFEKITGLKRDAVVGRTVREVLPDIEDYWIRIYGEVALTGRTKRFEQYSRALDKHFEVMAFQPAPGQFAAVFVDITERRQAAVSLQRVNRALRTISAGNEVLVHAVDESALLADICRVVVDKGGYKLAWIGLKQDDPAKTVAVAASAGAATGYLEGLHLSWADEPRGRGPTGRAIRIGAPYIVSEVDTEPDYEPWREAALRQGFASCIALPLSTQTGVLGALNIYSGDPGAFDDEEVRLLSELASDTAYGMISLRTRTRHVEAEAKVRQTVEQLKESLEQTVRAIAATVEQRDPYTAGHQRRVASLAAAIAKELGLADNEIEGIYVAGVIHDLGKIHIPAEILSKPARLNEIEYGLIKTHPQVGCEIIKNIHFPWPVAEMVLQHHERIDGSGYPKGLVNGQIVLGARILAVADVVEAMASHRPYRPGLGPDRALDEIERNAGVTYDPDVARACLDLFHQKRFAFDYGET